MAENCCNLDLTIDEPTRINLEVSGVNYYGPYELPTMSADEKGGAKLGSGLEIVSDTLSIDLTDEATGESVTAADASYLAGLTVDGKAVQDGTPTPNAPVDVQVVQGNNLIDISAYQVATRTNQGITYTYGSDGVHISGTNSATSWSLPNYSSTPSFAKRLPKGTYIISFSSIVTTVSVGVNAFRNGSSIGTVLSVGNSGRTFTLTEAADVFFVMRVNVGTINETVPVQIEAGSTATPYTPYGSIGLKVGSTITPIDLQGNVLASLPDGTKDVLTVDSAGHCVLSKNVGKTVFDGTETWTAYNGGGSIGYYFYHNLPEAAASQYTPTIYCSHAQGGTAVSPQKDRVCIGSTKNTILAFGTTLNISSAADFKTWLSSNHVSICYKLATHQTIDLGYIDMPNIPDGSTISIMAQVTPTISASWWARGAAAIAEALQAVCERINAIEAAIAELATA